MFSFLTPRLLWSTGFRSRCQNSPPPLPKIEKILTGGTTTGTNMLLYNIYCTYMHLVHTSDVSIEDCIVQNLDTTYARSYLHMNIPFLRMLIHVIKRFKLFFQVYFKIYTYRLIKSIKKIVVNALFLRYGAFNMTFLYLMRHALKLFLYL